MDGEGELIMATIKLGKLPDRTPVKLAISMEPDLYARLGAYAADYAAAYQDEKSVAELVPAMLAGFLDGDRDFIRRHKA